MMQSMMVAPYPAGAGGLFGSKAKRLAMTRHMRGQDDGTLARKSMPMIESSTGTAMREGNALPMPGPISGIGGGTFDIDGSQVTATENSQRGNGAPMRDPSGMANAGGPLGASMRQPFDYEAAMKALQAERKDPKAWQYALAAVGDALVANSGGTPYAMRNLSNIAQVNSDRQFEAAKQLAEWRYGDWQRQNEADLRAANPFTIGRERLGYNPATRQVDVLYRGRQDAEVYADSLGFDRGSEEWNAAVEDYVLRSSGPSAHQRDMEIDDYRTANDRSLEGYRQSNRMEIEGVRQRNRRGMVDYRNANPRPSRAGAARPTATNAQGNKVEWNGKAWVPVR